MRIRKEGNFVFGPGIRSKYNYDYSLISDSMNDAYCSQLMRKLKKWQKQHGQFDVVVGLETEGIRIGYRLAQCLDLPFHIMPHRKVEMVSLDIPAYPAEAHWLLVDDIIVTGTQFLEAVDSLQIEEKPESVTYACMIKRNPKNLDYSAVTGDKTKEQHWVRKERFDFIDKRLVYLFAEPE
ncbi:MAG: phosphoribosyltransferase [Nitrospinaceae bacterium]